MSTTNDGNDEIDDEQEDQAQVERPLRATRRLSGWSRRMRAEQIRREAARKLEEERRTLGPYEDAERGAYSLLEGQFLHYIVNVATYVGAAGIGGVIGGRVDAATVATAKRMFQAVLRRRDQQPSSEQQENTLTREDAIDLACAAAISQGLKPVNLHATEAPFGPYPWIVEFDTPDPSQRISVHIPNGNPAQVIIMIVVEDPRRR